MSTILLRIMEGYAKKVQSLAGDDGFYEMDYEPGRGKVLKGGGYKAFCAIIGELLELTSWGRLPFLKDILICGFGGRINFQAAVVPFRDKLGLNEKLCMAALTWWNKAMHTEALLAAMMANGAVVDATFGIASLYNPCVSCQAIVNTLGEGRLGDFLYARADASVPDERRPEYGDVLSWFRRS